MALDLLQVSSAFIGVSFRDEDKEVKEWFELVVGALGVKVVTGEEPDSKIIPEKIKGRIKESNAFIAIMTKRDQIEGTDVYKPPVWIHEEIGIAYTAGIRFVVFVEEGVELQGLSTMATEYVRFSRDDLSETIPKIIELILSLRGSFEESFSRMIKDNYSLSYSALKKTISKLEGILSVLKLQEASKTRPIRIIRFMKQGVETKAILGVGEPGGMPKDIVLEAYEIVSVGRGSNVEIRFCTLQVSHVQRDNLSQAIIVSQEGDTWESLEDSLTKNVAVNVPKNICKVVLPDEFKNSNPQAFEESVELLKRVINILYTEQ